MMGFFEVSKWLEVAAGSERVLEQILACYPAADLYVVVDFLPHDQRGFLGERQPIPSFIQHLPFARRHFRKYLPLMPLAVAQWDLAPYELVISSNHAVAKGVLTGPDQLHVSYVHSPMRYAWDLQALYLRESGLTRGLKSWFTRWILHRLRLWDCRTANGVDAFVANSSYIARRIAKTYRRPAEVIHPPVATDDFTFRADKEDFYLAVSRLVPYKKMDLVVEAFRDLPERRLIVIGDGPDMAKVRARAGANTTLLGYQPLPILRDHTQRARALLFAAEEDFGIVPVEAQACGTPVIAFGRGGARDSVLDIDQARPTGLLFAEQSAASLVEAVRRFEAASDRIRPKHCRENALRFRPEVFRARLTALVEREWTRLQAARSPAAP